MPTPMMTAMAFLGKKAEVLMKKCYEQAMQGDPTCMRLCIERLLPVAKERPLSGLTTTPVKHVKDVPAAMSNVLEQMSSGKLLPAEGQLVIQLMKTLTDTFLAVQADGKGSDPASLAAKLRRAAAAMDGLSTGGE